MGCRYCTRTVVGTHWRCVTRYRARRKGWFDRYTGRTTDCRGLSVVHDDGLRTRRVIARGVGRGPGDCSRALGIRSIQRLTITAYTSNYWSIVAVIRRRSRAGINRS